MGHLKKSFLAMYWLYLVLKDQSVPPTEAEKAIAAEKKTLNPTQAATYLHQLERSSMSISEAFKKQQQHAAISSSFPSSQWLNQDSQMQEKNWNQEEFKKLLIQWIVACDQPFDEVEKPEFHRLNFIASLSIHTFDNPSTFHITVQSGHVL